MNGVLGKPALLTATILTGLIGISVANRVAADHCELLPDGLGCETRNTAMCPSGCWLYTEGVELTPGTVAQVAWSNSLEFLFDRIYEIGLGRTWFQAYRCDTLIHDPSTLRGNIVVVQAWYSHSNMEDPCAMESCATNLMVYCPTGTFLRGGMPGDFLVDVHRRSLIPSDFNSDTFKQHLGEPKFPNAPEGFDDIFLKPGDKGDKNDGK